MSSSFSCPSCQCAVEVPPEQVGRWVSCPRCGKEFAAWESEPVPSVEREEEDEEPVQGTLQRNAGWLCLGAFLLASLLSFAVKMEPPRLYRPGGSLDMAGAQGFLEGFGRCDSFALVRVSAAGYVVFRMLVGGVLAAGIAFALMGIRSQALCQVWGIANALFFGWNGLGVLALLATL